MFVAFVVHRVSRELKANMIGDITSVWHVNQKKNNDSDYHGNFNADIFEKTFEDVCVAIVPYGSCISHMDGVSYHKHKFNYKPTKSKTKREIQVWNTSHGVNLEDILCDISKSSKVELLEAVEKNQRRY